MSDVFISYARSAEPAALQVADALRALGYGVWRDDEIPAHRSYAAVIEERLRAAKAVIVIWSAEAAGSQWVFSEANLAREERKLVQLRIDDSRLPLPFDTIECADLRGWSGRTDASGWRKVAASIRDLAGAEAKPTPLASEGPPPLPAKPSIAVVPFANLSNDPEQEYFVEGVAEEIVSALSRFKSLFVLSAGSDTVVAGRTLSPQEAASRLGVNYFLEGSLRKAGNRVRIAVHLIDAASGAEIWSNRLDDTMDDIFALQDRIAESVASAVEINVEAADLRKADLRPTTSASSYDLALRAISLFRLSQREEMLTAIDLLDRAITLDPSYAVALSQSAVCRRQLIDHGWCGDPDETRRVGLEHAERALRIGHDDARVLAQVAAALPGLENRLDRSVALLDRAIVINPYSALVWLISGSVRLRNGEPDVAAEHLETAIRLDPISPTTNAFARMYLASARFQQGRFDDALALFGTTSLRLPFSHAILASLYGHKGRIREGREALDQFEALDAGTVEDLARTWFAHADYRSLLMEGIEKLRE